ncbi:hypothetical protein CYMTET_27881 [Cymbomonas tetramitiformis]|uniref:CHCH domain-containing protein n=1 Tax=Cymbomonas tetramitiformis TaxID=36881 RepID=A0AAE0FP20_9CHLO|nr:hypothetical protein CYMTET_27881 [Cymbomonas tetramitiformis]
MSFFSDAPEKKAALDACAAEQLELLQCFKGASSFWDCGEKRDIFTKCYERERGNMKSKLAAPGADTSVPSSPEPSPNLPAGCSKDRGPPRDK